MSDTRHAGSNPWVLGARNLTSVTEVIHVTSVEEMGSVHKIIVWAAFIAGLVGAGLGIAALHVEVAVFWLIVASTSGLVLLKFRAAGQGRLA